VNHLISLGTILLTSVVASAHGLGATSAAPQEEVESRDMTSGKTWIQRLERSDRTPGLRIDDVAACLNLRPGVVLADIGAGAGAFTLPFAEAVRPSGKILAMDLWQELLDYIDEKARKANLDNIETILGRPDNPNLPKNGVDIAFFHDVFHNVPDRQAYLAILAESLKPQGRIAIIEQEFDDPIAQKWDVPENRITKQQLDGWMSNVGFHLVDEFDIFQGDNNPKGTGMPERWFVVYARESPQ